MGTVPEHRARADRRQLQLLHGAAVFECEHHAVRHRRTLPVSTLIIDSDCVLSVDAHRASCSLRDSRRLPDRLFPSLSYEVEFTSSGSPHAARARPGPPPHRGLHQHEQPQAMAAARPAGRGALQVQVRFASLLNKHSNAPSTCSVPSNPPRSRLLVSLPHHRYS